ncbi:MAG: crossover junction endodeoxyribonuclease RuvC [Clostridia bacterium]|nr:crossover junction endodeoxyribonuclease RuvC [Clostridia bacterium]
MVILGLDPGYATVGYGVIEAGCGRCRPIAYGAIETPKTARFPDRLKYIGDETAKLIARYNPDAIAIEELFFQDNRKTAILVAEARGVMLYVAETSGKCLFEYTPLQIKQALTGYGRAQKCQIQQMVKVMLCLEKIPKPDDAADALAVAITHSQTNTALGAFKI